jgi:chromate transport protein ChrA
MFWLWLIVAILLVAVGSYALGRWDTNEDKVSLFWTIVIGSLLWPAVLAAVIIVGPFFGLFWLGDRRREKRLAAAKAAAENK